MEATSYADVHKTFVTLSTRFAKSLLSKLHAQTSVYKVWVINVSGRFYWCFVAHQLFQDRRKSDWDIQRSAFSSKYLKGSYDRLFCQPYKYKGELQIWPRLYPRQNYIQYI